ncbi:MAG: hypothetical protein KF760_34900 [Candidatus Eremiobacteraeota bacterium]|nr:hypothetical protein [Candidatus Eremiobacteraeota bacterium]MCW5869645.1 hypothetical protein [Candidatus Eremiobacteraeota bacterium]
MKKRGYALPLSLCVAGVTLMLGLSAAHMTNGDLGLANHQYYQERARQMADYGLEYCVSHTVMAGSVLSLNSLSATHPFDTVTVQAYRFDTPGAPVAVPKGFEYWVAEGRAGQHQGSAPLASARVGALVCYGMPSGSSGAQVRSLYVNSPDAVDFSAWDGLTGQPVSNESVCASDYDGGAAPPLPFGGQTHVLDLGEVASFSGNFRIPRGVSQDVVHFQPGATVPVSPDGGPINVPTFSPPSGLPFVAGLSLPNDFDGPLPPGHYGSLEISPQANVHLNGTYHFDNLSLSGDTPAGQGGTLRVDSTDSAKVFVSKIHLGPGRLGLSNAHGSAQNFRFTLQVARPNGSAPDPLLNFKLSQGGGVALVADGHRVSLEADANTREIRGAFSARALEVKFPPGLSPFVRPRFVYDVSATTARRPTNRSTTDSANFSTTDGGSSSFSASSDQDTASNARSANGDLVVSGPGNLPAPGIEPMILSRQPL